MDTIIMSDTLTRTRMHMPTHTHVRARAHTHDLAGKEPSHTRPKLCLGGKKKEKHPKAIKIVISDVQKQTSAPTIS